MSALSARLPLLLTVLVTLVMLTALGWQGYSLWQQEQQPAQNLGQALAPDNANQVSREPQIKASEVALFGTASLDATPEEVDTQNLPETNLRLFLRGVMAADGDFPGSALIEDSSAKTEAYLVGDELPGNATLRSIFPNRVIINRAGKLENLYFPELAESTGMDFAADESEEQMTDYESQSDSGPTSASPPVTTPEASEQRRDEIRRRLEELRERLRNNSN